MKKKKKGSFFHKSGLFYFTLFIISILFWEMVAEFEMHGRFLTVWQFLFSLSWAAVFTLIVTLGGRKCGKIFFFILSGCLLLFYLVQMVYHHIFDSCLSLAQLGMGADAVTSFGKEAMLGILESIVPILMMFLPLAFQIVAFKVKRPCLKILWKRSLAWLGIFIALFSAAVLLLPLGGTESYTPYDLYHKTFVLNMSSKTFGPLTSLRLELRSMFFGSDEASSEIVIPASTQATEPTEPAEIVYEPNVTDVDFAALAAAETDETVKTLHTYFDSVKPTKQNEYTGMFQGYNVITLCCESFSTYVIDKDRTPLLYKMSTEGFRFTDYYDSICDNTSNGEYALNMGLLPDTSLLGRGWNAFYKYNSFTVSENNYLPFCLGNQLNGLGYRSLAFHYYSGNYYGRKNTHPNMGYTCYFKNAGLSDTSDWPTSDLDMMKQAMPKLLEKDESGNITPFNAYFLTFSGHMSYNFSSNNMAIKNKAVSADLPYSTSVKAYVSCQQELEYALEYMLEQLEAAGVADKTLIVLTADHYPYNLTLDKLSELAGKTLDGEFDKYRTSLLMWSPSMQESVTVSEPMCSLDILPTLSNLLGITYDSRLLMGTDVFSDGPHIATLADRSFVTDKVMYNSQTGEAVSRTGEAVDQSYIDSLITEVKNKFTVSTQILYKNYYKIIYPDGIQ